MSSNFRLNKLGNLITLLAHTKMNLHQLLKQSKENSDLLTIEATVTTGFEFLALDECREKCKPVSISKAKGRIFFNIPLGDFNKVLTLRAVDNVLLVVEAIQNIPFEGVKVKDLETVKSLVDTVDWDKSLKRWADISEFKGVIYPTKTTTDSLKVGIAKTDLINEPKETETSNTEKTVVENGSNVSSDIRLASIAEEKSECLTDLYDHRGNLSKSNKVEGVGINNSAEPTGDVIDEEVNHSEKELEHAQKEKENPNWMHEREVQCILDKETSREIDLDKDNASQLENVTYNKESKCDDLIEIECDQSNSLTQKYEGDSKLQTISDENKEDNKEFVNNGDFKNEYTIKENQSGVMEECRTLEADKKTLNKQQSRGKNRRFDKKKSVGRRCQRDNASDEDKSQEERVLKFRATCYRIGEKHSFGSMEAACEFGGTLQDKFGWKVDLTRFDLNVVLNIECRQGYVCVAITKESLHRRNISHFSSTTLRATMCYNLIRLTEPMTGEIVIDPLCGGGSISIEGALSFPNTYHICGDYNGKAIERSRANIDYINRTKTQSKIGAVLWDSKNLPLKPQSVDVLVTDLPFGKRSGAKRDNLRLYCRVLFEFAKVVKTGTGRVCLLTYDKTSLVRALRTQSVYWREIRQFGVNQGGLFSSVFLLLRKAAAIVEPTSNENAETKLTETKKGDIQNDGVSAENKSENDNSSLGDIEVTKEALAVDSALVDSILQSTQVSLKDEQFKNENIADDKLANNSEEVNDSSKERT